MNWPNTITLDTERIPRDLRYETLYRAVIVIPLSVYRTQGWRDEMERRFITFSELYSVLSFGPPGQYILEGA